jgi:hypothetical protein
MSGDANDRATAMPPDKFSLAPRRRRPVKDPRPSPPPVTPPERKRRAPVDDPAPDEPPIEPPDDGSPPVREPPRRGKREGSGCATPLFERGSVRVLAGGEIRARGE